MTAVVEAQCAIPTRDGVELPGSLLVPGRPRGLVVFVHGSGSSRRSPRNRAVAQELAQAGFATLLFDLLTEAEAEDRRNVFDIELLAQRLLDATAWARGNAALSRLGIGYFGASTGAAAALRAAAVAAADVRAVVSRGGRADLAGDDLRAVGAPTLLIVGGEDEVVLDLNEEAAARLSCVYELSVVPGAGHLFEEPGALERVAQLATDWFGRYLPLPAPA